jgi:hypothetical protein
MKKAIGSVVQVAMRLARRRPDLTELATTRRLTGVKAVANRCG